MPANNSILRSYGAVPYSHMKPPKTMDRLDTWKILVVDDEPEVHHLTEIVLEEFQFEGRGLALLAAYSGEEAKEMVRSHPDIALILLDVVMETDEAGLDVVRYVRESLKNHIVQIVLRTGQAGQAPHQEIISQYEINDYHSKVELTAARMITIVTASLRAYRLSLALLKLNDALREELDERKRAQAEIHRLTQFQESVIDSADIWLHVMTETGQMALWNKAAMTISGYMKAEVADEGALWRKIFRHDGHLPDQESVWAEFSSHDHELFDREVPVLCKNGEVRAIIWNSRRLYDHSGDPMGMIFLGRDVTEQKMLERQFRQAQKMEAVGRMAGGIAHDFNNLLTVIRGYCELSLIRLNEQNSLYLKLKQIDRAAEKGENLTRKLLSFSRNHVVTPSVIPLNKLIREMAEMIGRLVPKNIELVTRPADAEVFILADPGQMEQVIMNLVINAMDAMKEGGRLCMETFSITINEEAGVHGNGLAPGEYASLSISDTGVGMDEKTLDRLFEPFFTTKEKGKGTGLGLSTVYGIVKQVNGAIKVTSEPFKGARFDLYFPRIDIRRKIDEQF